MALAVMNPGEYHKGYAFDRPPFNNSIYDPLKITEIRAKTAVVANRRVYLGNVKVFYSDGTSEVLSDSIFKSEVGKFDKFKRSGRIDVAVDDGEHIIALAEYADRILQFKQRSLHILNVSQEIEYLEETHKFKGIANPAAYTNTDYGCAWVNDSGCYIYDGKSVRNILDKKELRRIKSATWDSFITDRAAIGYIPKDRQILVIGDMGDGTANYFDQFTNSSATLNSTTTVVVTSTAALAVGMTVAHDDIPVGTTIASIDVNGTNFVLSAAATDNGSSQTLTFTGAGYTGTIDGAVNAYLYDLVTDSWTYIKERMVVGNGMSNISTDYDNNLIYMYDVDGNNIKMAKWVSVPTATTAVDNDFILETKDFDFGDPGRDTFIYKLIVQYTGGTGQDVTVKYRTNGSGAYDTFSSTKLDYTTNQTPQTIEIKPSSTIKNKKSIQFQLTGTAAKEFVLNDMTIIYREKSIG